MDTISVNRKDRIKTKKNTRQIFSPHSKTTSICADFTANLHQQTKKRAPHQLQSLQRMAVHSLKPQGSGQSLLPAEAAAGRRDGGVLLECCRGPGGLSRPRRPPALRDSPWASGCAPWRRPPAELLMHLPQPAGRRPHAPGLSPPFSCQPCF